jgi:hypothetical protein
VNLLKRLAYYAGAAVAVAGAGALVSGFLDPLAGYLAAGVVGGVAYDVLDKKGLL